MDIELGIDNYRSQVLNNNFKNLKSQLSGNPQSTCT